MMEEILKMLNDMNSSGRISYDAYSKLFDAIENFDAVRVVRCKDCKW